MYNFFGLRKPGLSFLLSLLLCGLPLLSAAENTSDAAGPDARLKAGILAHNAAMTGDTAQLDAALKLLGPEGWDRPDLALGYHGSALTLKASKAKKDGNLFSALSLLDQGTKELDKAVSQSPASLDLRLLRMENSMALVETSPLDRSKEAGDDIAILKTRYDELKPEGRALVQLDSGRLALSAKKMGEAMADWHKTIQEAPDSEAAGRARKLLARYGD